MFKTTYRLCKDKYKSDCGTGFLHTRFKHTILPNEKNWGKK